MFNVHRKFPRVNIARVDLMHLKFIFHSWKSAASSISQARLWGLWILWERSATAYVVDANKRWQSPVGLILPGCVSCGRGPHICMSRHAPTIPLFQLQAQKNNSRNSNFISLAIESTYKVCMVDGNILYAGSAAARVLIFPLPIARDISVIFITKSKVNISKDLAKAKY